MKQPKILFFINGAVPTAAQNVLAYQLRVPVQFRNAVYAQEGDIEPCDGVIGEVPDIYSDIPDAMDVCEEYAQYMKEQLDAMTDEIGGEAYTPRRGMGRAQEAVPEFDDDGNIIEPTETKPNATGGWQGNK